ncbi:hypothetical protein ACE6H2_016080 [Prunus campanulata]
MEKDRGVDTTMMHPDIKKQRVDDEAEHQQPANPICLRINLAFSSFFKTWEASIKDTKLKGFEGRSTCGKTDVALQTTLEIKELMKRKEESDLLITKLRSVIDVEKKKVSDGKCEMKCMADKHAKDVGVIQDQDYK